MFPLRCAADLTFSHPLFGDRTIENILGVSDPAIQAAKMAAGVEPPLAGLFQLLLTRGMETGVIPSLPVRSFNAGEQLCLNTDLGTVKDDFGGIFLDPVQSFAGRLLSCLHLSIQFNPSVTGILEIDLRRPGVLFAIPGLLP